MSKSPKSKLPERFIPSTLQISAYCHCGLCLKELQENKLAISPKDYQSVQFGFTEFGIQVWCKRHDVNILHIDFQGISHPANTSRSK